MATNRTEHGGGLGRGRRKVARPISTRDPMYVILRSTRAKGRLSLQKPAFAGLIREMVERQAAACRIQLLQFLNEGDSLHFLLKVPSRPGYLRFIRSVSGLTSRMVTGAERGPAQMVSRLGAKTRLSPKAQSRDSRRGLGTPAPAAKANKKNRFWDILPYSRVALGCATIRAAQRQANEPALSVIDVRVMPRATRRRA